MVLKSQLLRIKIKKEKLLSACLDHNLKVLKATQNYRLYAEKSEGLLGFFNGVFRKNLQIYMAIEHSRFGGRRVFYGVNSCGHVYGKLYAPLFASIFKGAHFYTDSYHYKLKVGGLNQRVKRVLKDMDEASFIGDHEVLFSTITPPFYAKELYERYFRDRYSQLMKQSSVQHEGEYRCGLAKVEVGGGYWCKGEVFYRKRGAERYLIMPFEGLFRACIDFSKDTGMLRGRSYYESHEVRFCNDFIEFRVHSKGQLRDTYGEFTYLGWISYKNFTVIGYERVVSRIY